MDILLRILKLSPLRIFLYFLFFCGFSCADPPYSNCSSNTSTYSENSPFQKNLDDLLQRSVSEQSVSFGVLLIEIITGKSNASFHQTQHGPSLLAYAWHLWQKGQVTELMDPQVDYSCETFDEFLKYVHVGMLCVQEDAYDRPTMSSVVVMLTSESTSLNQPKRPAFFTGRFEDRCNSIVEDNLSINSLTASNVTPR